MPPIVIQMLVLLIQEAPQLIGLAHQFMQDNGRAPTADELAALASSFQTDLAAADAAIKKAGGDSPASG